MKIFLTVWVLLILASLANCRIERTMQVKEIILRLAKIDPGGREDRGQMYWLTWKDDSGTPYLQFCPCPNYKIGDTQKFLITR